MAHVYLVRGNNCQLANQLVLFASLYAWCRHRGHTLSNPSFYRYAHLFDGVGGAMITAGVGGPWNHPAVAGGVQRVLRVASGAGGLFGPRVSARQRDPVVLLPPSDEAWAEPGGGRAKRIFLSGWNFRNPAGLVQYHDDIVRVFRPREPERGRVAAWAAGLDRSRLNVGVHVRHGDYREFLGGRFYFTAAQYREQMLTVAERYAARRPVFHIFSNEARREDEFAGLDVRICSASALEDLYRLAACDLIVGAMSTFSLWAAIYGRTLALHMGRRKGDEFSWFSEGHPTVLRLEDADGHVAERAKWQMANRGRDWGLGTSD